MTNNDKQSAGDKDKSTSDLDDSKKNDYQKEDLINQEGIEKEIDSESDLEDQSDIDNLHKEILNLKDQLLRSMAENENIRRRSKKELEDTNKYAITNFSRDILSISDNLRRALESADMDDEIEKSESFINLKEGVELTERELLSVLSRYGIKKIEPMDERFDAKFHQAMFEEETIEKEPGTIIQVMQAGYTIGERLLRPAMVGIAKKPKIDKTE
mgnify:CR=1 FL=1